MIVHTQRETVGGETVEAEINGQFYENAPHSSSSVGHRGVLGEVTAIKELDGGFVSIEDSDGNIRQYTSVLDVTRPPMMEKARLTFIADSSELVPLGTIRYARERR